MKLITIWTFENSVEAHLAKSKLESEGIPCFLANENFSNLMPIYNVATGGIKLKVDERDWELAREIVNRFRNSTLLDENGEEIRCTKCGSKELYNDFRSYKSNKGMLSILISFLLMVYPFYQNTVYRCKECNTEFDKAEQPHKGTG